MACCSYQGSANFRDYNKEQETLQSLLKPASCPVAQKVYAGRFCLFFTAFTRESLPRGPHSAISAGSCPLHVDEDARANPGSRGPCSRAADPCPEQGNLCPHQMEAGLLPHLQLSCRGPAPLTRCGWDAGPESWTHRPPCKSGLVTGVFPKRGAHWARPPLGAGSTREQGRRGAVGVGLSGLAPAPSGAFLGRGGHNANPGPRIPRQVRVPRTRSPRRNLDAEQRSVGARDAGGAGQVGPAAGPACSPGSHSWKLSSGSHTLLTSVRLALQEP